MKLTKAYGAFSIFIAMLYFSIAIFLLNVGLVFQTILGNTSLASKLVLLFALLQSSWVALHHLDFFLLMTTSLLVGINVSLSFMLLTRLKKVGRVSLALSGGTMLGVFSTGCASCGFSALSLFGLSGTVAFLPLESVGLYALAISLLLFTLYYNIKTIQKPLVCKPQLNRKLGKTSNKKYK
jgi:hypothetical protein